MVVTVRQTLLAVLRLARQRPDGIAEREQDQHGDNEDDMDGVVAHAVRRDPSVDLDEQHGGCDLNGEGQEAGAVVKRSKASSEYRDEVGIFAGIDGKYRKRKE